jgi:hypothetical protein
MVESGPKVSGADLLELRYLRMVGQGELSRPVRVAWDARNSPVDSHDDVLDGLKEYGIVGVMEFPTLHQSNNPSIR